MYNLTGLGKLLKLAGIEKVFEKSELLQIVKQIDSVNNNSVVFCHKKLISTF